MGAALARGQGLRLSPLIGVTRGDFIDVLSCGNSGWPQAHLPLFLFRRVGLLMALPGRSY